eukprot:gene10827-biopygen13885
MPALTARRCNWNVQRTRQVETRSHRRRAAAVGGGGGRRRRLPPTPTDYYTITPVEWHLLNSFSCLANVAASATNGTAPYTSGRAGWHQGGIKRSNECLGAAVISIFACGCRKHWDVHQCVSTGVQRDGVAYKEKKQHAGERKAYHAGTARHSARRSGVSGQSGSGSRKVEERGNVPHGMGGGYIRITMCMERQACCNRRRKPMALYRGAPRWRFKLPPPRLPPLQQGAL